MPIATLDLQQLMMQQSHVARMEHARQAVKNILVQSEDRDIHKDAYRKDSTVVKTEETSDENMIKERKEPKKDSHKHYMSYRKRRSSKSSDKNIPIIEKVDVDSELEKGSIIDILG